MSYCPLQLNYYILVLHSATVPALIHAPHARVACSGVDRQGRQNVRDSLPQCGGVGCPHSLVQFEDGSGGDQVGREIVAPSRVQK